MNNLTMAEKFSKLAALPADWDSYGSPRINRDALIRARQWLDAVQVVPCSDGGVQLEWHGDGIEVEVYFRADGFIGGLFAFDDRAAVPRRGAYPEVANDAT